MDCSAVNGEHGLQRRSTVGRKRRRGMRATPAAGLNGCCIRQEGRCWRAGAGGQVLELDQRIETCSLGGRGEGEGGNGTKGELRLVMGLLVEGGGNQNKNNK